MEPGENTRIKEPSEFSWRAVCEGRAGRHLEGVATRHSRKALDDESPCRSGVPPVTLWTASLSPGMAEEIRRRAILPSSHYLCWLSLSLSDPPSPSAISVSSSFFFHFHRTNPRIRCSFFLRTPRFSLSLFESVSSPRAQFIKTTLLELSPSPSSRKTKQK